MSPQELTPAPCNVRSRIHGYGGGALAVATSLDQLFLVWVDDCNGCLWTQTWEGILNLSNRKELILKKLTQPICISKKDSSFLGDGLIDIKRMRWLGVMEKDKKDFLTSFSLLEEFQDPNIVYRALDFIGYVQLSPDSAKLTWIEWNQLSMPWDQSQVFVGYMTNSGELSASFSITEGCFNSELPTSFFQPIWLTNYNLIVSEDSSGWWNLTLFEIKKENPLKFNCKSICKLKEETAMPQWVAGMSTISVSNKQIVALSCDNSIWKLNVISLDGNLERIDLPFDDLSYLDVSKDRAVMIASNPYKESTLLEVDLKKRRWSNAIKKETFLLVDQEISVGESLWFSGFNNLRTHAWYYPPIQRRKNKSPLLVKIHSGPTGMASRGFNRVFQFWTSRGWGVLDVNYSGSSGFGREYRHRLKGRWGQIDVIDCYSAVLELVRLGKADKEYIAIEGSSAGGFTALGCLCYSNIFKVAACKYPVTDLIAMHKTTHRFEQGYLDYLVGPFPENTNKYINNSPVNNLDKITSPVIFFHGLKDNVVMLNQVSEIYYQLKNKLIPVELKTFKDEGHGFRDSITNIQVLNLTEEFFKHHLRL